MLLRILAAFVLASPLLLAQETISVPVILHARSGTTTINVADFTVTIKGKKTSVKAIKPLADYPLHYVIVHDSSGSEKKNAKNGTLNSAPELLLRQIVKSGHDRGSLVNFSNDPYIDVQESDDPSKLLDKLERTPNGGSAIFDATAASADYLAKHPWQLVSRDVIFLFTDGVDNASYISFSSLITHLATMKIPVFIFISQLDDRQSYSRMNQLAAATGGQIYLVRTPEETKDAIDRTQRDLKNSFLLTIDVPLQTHGNFQTLSITGPNMSVFAPAALDIKKPK
jgi:hypothetical protein